MPAGVQPLLDGVSDYLPAPTEVVNTALDIARGEAQVAVPCSPSGPFVGLAFKLEEGRYGQLTYMRVYSGKVRGGGSTVDWLPPGHSAASGTMLTPSVTLCGVFPLAGLPHTNKHPPTQAHTHRPDTHDKRCAP